jgi:nucleotide-binding universal stress UspA family protein
VVVASVASPGPGAAGGAFGLSPCYCAAVAGQTGLRTDEAIWEQHRERVESFFASRGVPVEFEGVLGRPADEIVLLAEQERADLIVVGTREPGFVERLLGGSVSQGVARRARCDVLIVHPPEDD